MEWAGFLGQLVQMYDFQISLFKANTQEKAGREW